VYEGLDADRAAQLDAPGPGGGVLRKAARAASHKLAGGVQGITPDELRESAEEGAEFFLMDLRSREEWKAGHLPGAASFPFLELSKRARDIPRYTPLVLYSASSNRAWQAASMLRAMGAKDVFVLDGGFALWPHEVEMGK
jgi:rhodanese-related sulfurtransferase